ncbi:MAG: hypothetical protein JWO24_2940 [Rhodospirillales bacterium]|nr:hypothetical protein [Rhodospirillales bacterium]
MRDLQVLCANNPVDVLTARVGHDEEYIVLTLGSDEVLLTRKKACRLSDWLAEAAGNLPLQDPLPETV